MAADLGLNITGEGTPIVMVMGRNASGRVWDAHQVPGLVARGWRVATFDNRGSGGNINPEQQFHFNDLVQDVLTIIDQHLGEPAFLVGTSLGSRIVLEAARQRPDLVRGVVAAAAHARLTPLQIAQSKELAAVTDALSTVAPDYLAATTATLNLSPSTLLDDAASADWLALLTFAGQGSTVGLAQQIAADCGSDQSQHYPQITVPVLTLAYADDRVIFPEQVRDVAQLIPGAEYVELPRAGHFGYLERPNEFNELVHEFFTRTSTT